jgi:predicted NAD-dependent protein-ADP-ribosyltransferase YbiA (DUF1768 family)
MDRAQAFDTNTKSLLMDTINFYKVLDAFGQFSNFTLFPIDLGGRLLQGGWRRRQRQEYARTDPHGSPRAIAACLTN